MVAKQCKKWCFLLLAFSLPLILPVSAVSAGDTVGVIFVLHGGMDEYSPQNLWNSAVHMFSYDQNHPVYQMVIWNPLFWSAVLKIESGVKFVRKYEFEYERIGGLDPFHALSDNQLADMKAVLDNNTDGLTYEVDYASWMSGDRVEHYAYPRFLNSVPGLFSGYRPLIGLSPSAYCGQQEEDGPWDDCDPQRYDVDGPVERLLKKGATRIIVVDLTVGGVRFYKTFDVVQMTRRALAAWEKKNNVTVPLIWVNDYSNLMEDSYPLEPGNWTPFLGPPDKDSHKLVSGRPNPVAADADLTLLNVEGIEAALSEGVADNDTGFVLFNHGLFDADRAFFDPKIDDTIVLNSNIKDLLLERHPAIDPDNVIGAWGGIRELNPENGLVERTRTMRGEALAYTNYHESDQDLPGDEWGYRYWEALEYLKDRGVRHIVIAFPQVSTDSVLTFVELYNQIGKEIGTKTWLRYGAGDFTTYPDVGHPFTDYWGNWVDTTCDGEDCCFEMGGCADGREYPPPRQEDLDRKRDDMDPSLAYDLSDYGHLGYDPALGSPDPDKPVQDQYTGTWELYTTPSDDPRVGKLLAKHVRNAAVKPLVYLTNGEVKSIAAGATVTWKATITGGMKTASKTYTYAWSLKREGVGDWQSVGTDSATWEWTPEAADTGTYDVKCVVVDSDGYSADIVWESFSVSSGS